ncbi:MAG TPA: hypothetical protein VIN40_10450 [Candidatus Tyrphobacter sp.]
MQLRVLPIVGAVALLASGTGALLSAPAQDTPAARISTTDCSTAQLSDIIGAYVTTPSPRVTPAPIPASVRSYLSHILRQRLGECRAILRHGASGPLSAAQACRPSTNEYDVRLLWTHLEFCVSLVHPSVPRSPVIQWQLPPRSGSGNRPVIFVIGTGADQAMISKLVSTLVVYLNDGRDETGYYFAGDADLVPEPGWTAEIYAAQCESSPQVEGAIVVQITAAGSGAADEFIRRRNWTAIEAVALYAQCVHRVPSYVWISDMAKVENHRITLTPLTPLATLLTLGAAYLEFAPTRTNSTATTRIFTNPAKPTPPPSGRVTQIVTSNGTSLNASGLGGVAGGLLGSSINYSNAVAPLSAGPAVDQQTWDALQSIASDLMKDMNCWQPRSQLIGTQDVIGRSRTLLAYNPPAGLGEHRTGEPSAPFCTEPGTSESIRDLLPPTPPH